MKHKFLLGLVVLAMSISGCSSLATSPTASQTTTTTSEQNTAVASLGNITLTATGAGSLIATNQTALSFLQGGTLVELVVQEGELVEAGAVVARLRVDISEAELEKDRSAAEMAVIQAQQALDKLNANANLDAAQALIRLEAAQAALKEAEDTAPALAEVQQVVAAAKAGVEEAEMQLYISQSTASSDARYTAYAALLFKQKALVEIEKQADRLENQIKNAQDKTQRDRLKHQMLELEVRLANQQLVVNEAQAKLDALNEPVNDDEVALAQARLATAEAQLEDAERQLEQVRAGDLNGTPSGDLLLAQAELNEAQAAWNKLQAGPDPNALALAEAELNEAKARLAQVEQTRLTLELVTPIRGTVLEINHAVGDRVDAKQTVLTVGDMALPSLEVYLDETDMNMAEIGARVEIVLDVLPDITVSGMVIQVDPVLSTSGNAKTGRLLVQLDDSSELGSRWLPVGLNATVDVIGGEAANVVLIPTEALQATTAGGYEVYLVTEDGKVTLQPVTIGLMDATRAEIQSGLEAGQTVILGDPEI